MNRFVDLAKKYIKRYAVYIVILLALVAGSLYRKDLLREQSKTRESTDGGNRRVSTIILNSNLHGKSTEEKRKYLLNNFAMDCFIGDSAAKVTIVDYSSFSCKYCRKMRPEIRKIVQEYVIDKKVVRYALRPIYGVKNIQIGAFLQCSKPEDRLRIAEELFDANVDAVSDVSSFLVDLGKKYGMDEEYVKNCISDEDTYGKIIYMQQNSREVFNINVTPLLVINDHEKIGYRSYEQIRDVVENILGGARE
ncbi:MAG: DsbA family protein [Rickettsiales bacterium]|jgi:protein-disulfide isomerase|nr:DsbA family protein [Rickettsiales bacterium]